MCPQAGEPVKDVVLWGGTGQARVLREALSRCGSRVVAVFDNKSIPSPFPEVPIYLGQQGFRAWLASRTETDPVRACVAIGGTRGSDRLSIQEWLKQQSMQPLTVVHPHAFVATDATMGEGAQILAMSAICSGARLGRAVIVNTSASVEHDCVIGDGVHVGPGAHLAGEVCVDEYAFIGTGAVVLPRIKIGRAAIVGAGAVVVRNVAAGEVVVGNPARVLRHQNA